ncbi:MAG: hypothetical protein NW224_30575 [Leptolyngbyaceae cyanobacterium bins.302]|nr:hypothetical protein [Leptolyngbyaceae cyanobacterium bins.302]
MGTYSPRSPSKHPKSIRKGTLLPGKAPNRASLSTKPAPLLPRKRSFPWQQLWMVGGAIAIVLSAGASTAGIAWLSYRLIVNPQAEQWANRWIPGWQVPSLAEEKAKTLQEIRAELRRQGRVSGELLLLGKNQSWMDGKTTVTDVLLPVIQTQPNCYSNCDRIVELRIYQTALDSPKTVTAEEKYDLVHQLPVAGLEESFAIAPLVDATSSNQGSSRMLPLNQLSQYEGTVPKQGVWLNLSGSRVRGDEAIAYGQILFYYPKHRHLSAKLSWTSPTAEVPVWKEVTGGNTPELIVNHTLGMEPQFEIYQVKPQRFVHSPVQLEQIALSAAAVEHSHYESALLLARSRLWSTSLVWLKALKARSPQLWTATAQAQMDLIQWHAQATSTQAESSWASPSQQVLANLLDGRWERATTVFESSVAASQETLSVLKSDLGRLENRVKAALRVNPGNLDTKAWGALLIAAQQSPNNAIAWLQKRPKTSPQDIIQIRALIQRLDPNFSDFQPSQSLPEPTPNAEVPGVDGAPTPSAPP